MENPDIRYRDSLAQDHAGEEEKYTLVLANPPFAGSLDDKRTELLPPEKLDPVPKTALTADEHAKNNLPDILARWRSFGVPPSGGKAHERRGE